jgi:hypothetical protein
VSLFDFGMISSGSDALTTIVNLAVPTERLAESSTLVLGHLQFEALVTAARLSPNMNEFALIAMLGLLGLRIFEACGAAEAAAHAAAGSVGPVDRTIRQG